MDDEPFILDFIYQALRQAAHSVVTTSSGEKALSHVERESFDLIVSDVKMPKMGGIELANRLIARQPEIACRILLMSGDMTLEPGSNSVPAGVRLLPKPFTHLDLLQAISAFQAAPAAPLATSRDQNL